jgi:hypothetical protein
MTWAPVNPTVFNTATSVRLSRTAMLMVFAVTRRIVKHTARLRPFKSTDRSPTMDMKSARNAFSVWVRVGSSEFSKSASIVLPTSAACRGLSISTMYKLVRAVPPRAVSRYLKWKNMMSVSVPGYLTGSVSTNPRTTNSKGPSGLRSPEAKLSKKKWSPIFQPNFSASLRPMTQPRRSRINSLN